MKAWAKFMFAVTAIAGAGPAATSAEPMLKGYVSLQGGEYSFQPTTNPPPESALAYGTFDPESNHNSGFAVLNVQTFSAAAQNTTQQFFAAGFLEGVLTAPQIYDMYTDLLASWPALAGGPPANLTSFLDTQDRWVRQQIAANTGDKFWDNVGQVQAQYDGLVAGYASAKLAGKALPLFAFRLLNGCGDFFDIIPKTCPGERPDFDHMSSQNLSGYMRENGHCSAVIKVTPDFGKLLMGHSSWFRYQVMVRIMKHYKFEVSSGGATAISFSSYPGFLESLDDFYITNAGLVMLQTTNNYFNKSLYDFIVPESVQAWMRVRAAMSGASSGREWCKLAGTHNSGTYTNMYMVVDLKKFTPNNVLADDTLWVCEQLPGLWVATDQTTTLARGYWPSYNRPFHKEIYDVSGFPSMVAKHGPSLSYQLATRAKIFRRDHETVHDLESLKAILRYNNYKNDPFSAGDPTESICARGDLKEEHELGGCYDTKATDDKLAQQMRSAVISGPTTSHNLPPFSWAPFANVTHLGQPTLFNNSFEMMQPSWL